MVNLDKPSTWREFKKGLCNDCRAYCCRMPLEVQGFDLVRMGICSDFDVELGSKHILKNFAKTIKSYSKKTNKFTLIQMVNGDCQYLDLNRRCSIYEIRPETCRNHPNIGPRPGFCAYERK